MYERSRSPCPPRRACHNTANHITADDDGVTSRLIAPRPPAMVPAKLHLQIHCLHNVVGMESKVFLVQFTQIGRSVLEVYRRMCPNTS